jgi:5'(3')-deoxyribonucleotidase
MDGVLVDFATAAFKLHGVSYTKYPPGWLWDIVGAINSISPQPISEEDFWGQMDEYFWATLPKTDMCDELVSKVAACFGCDNIWLLTSSGSPESQRGKIRWVRNNLPKFLHDKVIISSAKQFCAAPLTLLIDDCDENVDAFREAGGEALLVPRAWNSSHAKSDCCKKYVFQVIDAYHYLLEQVTCWG